MKNKILASLAVGIPLLGLVGAASATTMNFSSTDTAADKTSAYTYLDDFKIETFNRAELGKMPLVNPGLLDQSSWLWSANGSVVNGSLSGVYAAPYGLTAADQTNFLSVPNPNSPDTLTAELGDTYNYFGLWWGSVDAYNTLSFYKDGILTESFSGADVKLEYATAFGDQTASATNIYVNFMDLGDFDTFAMTSTSMAFEVDNIAVGNSPVPEPATMLLFGAGLIGVAGFRFRQKKR